MACNRCVIQRDRDELISQNAFTTRFSCTVALSIVCEPCRSTCKGGCVQNVIGHRDEDNHVVWRITMMVMVMVMVTVMVMVAVMLMVMVTMMVMVMMMVMMMTMTMMMMVMMI